MDQFPRIQNGILVFSVHHAQERSHSHPPPPTQSRIHPVLSPSPSIIVRRTTTTRRRRREEGGRVRHDVRRSPGIVFIYSSLLMSAGIQSKQTGTPLRTWRGAQIKRIFMRHHQSLTRHHHSVRRSLTRISSWRLVCG